jgi:transposase-like protein
MALYIPDYTYIEAKEIVEKLKGKNAYHIKYYIQKQEDYIEELEKKIKEMQAVFDGLSKYIR